VSIVYGVPAHVYDVELLFKCIRTVKQLFSVTLKQQIDV